MQSYTYCLLVPVLSDFNVLFNTILVDKAYHHVRITLKSNSRVRFNIDSSWSCFNKSRFDTRWNAVQ